VGFFCWDVGVSTDESECDEDDFESFFDVFGVIGPGDSVGFFCWDVGVSTDESECDEDDFEDDFESFFDVFGAIGPGDSVDVFCGDVGVGTDKSDLFGVEYTRATLTESPGRNSKGSPGRNSKPPSDCDSSAVFTACFIRIKLKSYRYRFTLYSRRAQQRQQIVFNLRVARRVIRK
jgi:hypothetical protein